MISVSFQVLALIYLGLMLSPIIGAWFLNEIRRNRRKKTAFRHVLQCNICAFEYEDRTPTLLPRCPRCGSLNERYRLTRV